MAPEMIQNGSHNHTLDVWCLGILLYEMLHGEAPFRGQSYNSISERIMRGKIKFDKKRVPKDLQDLILCILQRKANERIPLIKVFDHHWIKRMQDKHNIGKDPSRSKRSRKESSKEQEVLGTSKSKENIHDKAGSGKKVSMYINPAYDENDADVPEPPHVSYKRKKEKNPNYYEENKIEASPNRIEQELLKIEHIEAKKRKIIKNDKSKDSKHANILLKPQDKQKKVAKEENHNLLNLSQFDDKAPSAKKFTKLENIPSKSKSSNKNESTLPKTDERDAKSAKPVSKSKNDIFTKKEVAIEILKPEKDQIRDVEHKPEDIQAELDLLDESDDEDDLLSDFKKNVKDSSFILNDPKYSQNKSRATGNDDFLKEIEGIDSRLDELEIDDDDTGRSKNKSNFLDIKSNNLSIYQSKPISNGGDKIMKVINNFGVEKYNEHVKKANDILMDDDSDDEKYKYKPKQIPSEKHDLSNDIIKNEDSKYSIKEEVQSGNKPGNDNEKILFLNANKSYLDENQNSKINYDVNEEEPFSKDRKYYKLDKNKSDNILEPVPHDYQNENGEKKANEIPLHQKLNKNQIRFLNEDNSNDQNDIEEDPPSLKKPSDEEDQLLLKTDKYNIGDDILSKVPPKKNKIEFLQADHSAHYTSSKDENSSNNSEDRSRPSPKFLNFKPSVNDPYNTSYISKPVENDDQNQLYSPNSSHNSLFFQDKQKQKDRIQKFGKPHHHKPDSESEVFDGNEQLSQKDNQFNASGNDSSKNRQYKSKQLFKLQNNQQQNSLVK